MLACTTRQVRRWVRREDYHIDEEFDGGDGDDENGDGATPTC